MNYTSSSQYRSIAGRLVAAVLPSVIAGLVMGYVTIPGCDMIDSIRKTAPFTVPIVRRRLAPNPYMFGFDPVRHVSPRIARAGPDAPKVMINVTFGVSKDLAYFIGLRIICYADEAWDFLCGIDGPFADALAKVTGSLGQWSNRKPARLPVVLKAVRAGLRRVAADRGVSYASAEI